MKILTVVGARPQFIKAAAVSRAIAKYNLENSNKISESIIHTGQHYDSNLSEVFFTELQIPTPKYNLEISQGNHGDMTGRMLIALEEVMLQEKPDIVLIYGDTNSTMAGAIASAKLNIPIAHVEAGLRSFNRKMPEEINRIVADSVSNLLFCPTETAVKNLKNEGVIAGVSNVGDVMYDVTLFYKERAIQQNPLSKWGVEKQNYVLCTVHRAENTDDDSRLKNIIDSVVEISKDITVLLPLHPRTRKMLDDSKIAIESDSVQVMEPISYFEMLSLEAGAKVIFTDSGGVQKEAFFNKVPCVTLRDETEWVETVELCANRLCGADKNKILTAWQDFSPFDAKRNPYGDGNSSDLIVEAIYQYIS